MKTYHIILIYIFILINACSTQTISTRNPSVRAEFQREFPCPLSGNTRGPCPGYVVDHIKPLCMGGEDSIDNMQWQEYHQSILKDNTERAACRNRLN